MITAYVPRPQTSCDDNVMASVPLDMSQASSADDPVNHPSHYTYGSIETIDFIEDKALNFNRGNAVKYITRAGHKADELQDLEKARWYIDREISRIRKGKNL